MAASVNPFINNIRSIRNGNGITITTATTINDGGRSAVPENFGSRGALRHGIDLSVQWTPDEQSLLEKLLVKYASDTRVMRYAKIAGKLQDKTARDVALRCKWMTKKEISKRRKDDNLSMIHKDKKEKLTDQQANSSSHATNGDDGISYKAIGGTSGKLLEQNAHALEQISANFSAFKIHENVDLFCQTRNNILAILNDLNDMPGITKQMPPLPVKLNVELANSILPPSYRTMQP